jgi:Transposase DDE domain
VKLQPKNQRVQKYIARHLSRPGYRWDKVTDPREKRGRRWKFRELMNALFLGLASGCPTLRAVEGMSEDMGAFGRRYIGRRAPDTTLWDITQKLSSTELREQHIAQVKQSWRAKELRPVGLPCGVLSVDGKGLGALEDDAGGTAQKTHNGQGYEYYLARSLRAVLTSAEGRPCLDQMPIGPKTNEMGDFGRFFDRLIGSYGDNNDLFEIVTTDAGLTSLANANRVHQANKAYVMALKGPQQELLAEAERLLGTLRKPEAETPRERYKGKWIRRRIFRTYEIAGYNEWTHLRQVWRVEQITEYDCGKVEREQRYFLTSLTKGRLTAEQCFLVVRGHWRIECDCFETLDLQWNEDSVPWFSGGVAIEVLSWFRLMAYNLLQLARRRHLRAKLSDGSFETPSQWQRLFEWVKQAWLLPIPPKAKTVCG